MKAVLGFVLLCGVMLSVDAACSISNCPVGSYITTDTRCVKYRDTYDCLMSEKTKCTTTSQSDTLLLAIDRNLALRHGLECGAAGITISVFTLLLSLMAALLKL